MPDQRRGRQVQRTQRLLQEALIALIAERGYAAVTVQDVLDRADVGRATFYSHFANKDALLLSVFASLRRSLREELSTLTPERVARFGHGVGLMMPLFEHAAKHRRLYRSLLTSRDGALLLHYLRDALSAPLQSHLEQLATSSGRHAAPVPLIVAGFVSAILGMLVWWLESGTPQTPAEMDRIIEQLLAPAVAHLFTGAPHPPALFAACTHEVHASEAVQDVHIPHGP